MKVVVITGSTRGIGYGLAESFLTEGCAVAISGRAPETVETAVQALAARFGPQHVMGLTCDVSDFVQVQALWEAAKTRFGRVDIWINNAGQAHAQTPFWDLSPEQMRSIVETNTLGTILGTKVAVLGMRAQGGGAVYNMEGLGSSGMQVKGLAVYGTTKAGIHYFNQALAKELEGTPVICGSLSPGMVVTDMLTVQRGSDPQAWERQKRIFNILADRVETVTPWLAKQVLENTRNGAQITWAGRVKMMLRFLTAPFVKRQVID
jgi:NAD(P)-dependent dehydrogenase (short-subunit alcohol dehydrogenase family)